MLRRHIANLSALLETAGPKPANSAAYVTLIVFGISALANNSLLARVCFRLPGMLAHRWRRWRSFILALATSIPRRTALKTVKDQVGKEIIPSRKNLIAFCAGNRKCKFFTIPTSRMKMNELAELISEARNMVVLTGAGISTESGIPDFRSPGGIWEKFRIIEYSEFMASEKARQEDWRRRFHMEDQLGVVKPNIGHKVIADWVNSGKCSKVITQNIDGLHQLAGTPADSIVEIHGSARHANCTKCGLRHEISECRAMLEQSGHSPQCTKCHAIVKSAVVMFGQQMPKEETELAFKAANQCDLFMAIGTSLVVQPANELPVQAKLAGAKLAIINREKTELNWSADLVIHAEVGETLVTFLPN